MADIRKRTGAKGTTYQVRYPSEGVPSGYAYATFATMKEARAFREDSAARAVHQTLRTDIATPNQAIERWLDICEKEGTDGNEPVTTYTLKTYRYLAEYLKPYNWPKSLPELDPPDIINFRTWLISSAPSRYVARRALSCFVSALQEMTLRGHLSRNPAAGISISSGSRYDQPVTPPTMQEFRALLAAADRLANSKNVQVARAWRRYRPMLYLAGDTGMRPGEYLGLPQFNLEPGKVKVDRAVERSGHTISVTKTPAGWRWIDVSPEVMDMVLHYAEHHAKANQFDLVFPTSSGRWQSIINWRKLGFAAACEEAGLIEKVEEDGETRERPRFSPYDLRHFYASMLIEKGVSLKRIQTLMGHTNITTTLNIYGHLIDKAESAGESNLGIISQIQ